MVTFGVRCKLFAYASADVIYPQSSPDWLKSRMFHYFCSGLPKWSFHICVADIGAWSCRGFYRKSTPLHVATAHMTISPSPTASQHPFARRVVERRTVHSGAVRDRRAPTDAALPLQTHEDSAVIGKTQRVSLFNRLTSKFTKRYSSLRLVWLNIDTLEWWVAGMIICLQRGAKWFAYELAFYRQVSVV